MNLPETITVKLDDGDTFEVEVEEFHPLEPSAYCWDAGWTCYGGDTEYFVSQDGTVYRQPENAVCGVAPVIREAADKLEAQMARWEED